MYFALIILSVALGLGTQAYINSTYNKWAKVPIDSQLSGSQTARFMLDQHQCSDVEIHHIGGHLSDNYDPRTHSLNLSDESYHGRSVSAVAVACHEAGHAVQHARHYFPARVRKVLVPAVQFASQFWMIVLLAGLFLHMAQLVAVGIYMFAAIVLFQLVTLPVEIDASRRAMASISSSGQLSPYQVKGARQVLIAAALTYVAAALVSVLQLIHFMSMRRD